MYTTFCSKLKHVETPDGYSMTNGKANTFTHNLERIKLDTFAFNLISTKGKQVWTTPQCLNAEIQATYTITVTQRRNI